MRNIEHVTKFFHEKIKEQNVKNALYANKLHKNHDFKVGGKVWLSSKNLTLEDRSGSRKLNPRFYRSFEIMKKINHATMRLILSEPMKAKLLQNALHVSLLEPV